MRGEDSKAVGNESSAGGELNRKVSVSAVTSKEISMESLLIQEKDIYTPILAKE